VIGHDTAGTPAGHLYLADRVVLMQHGTGAARCYDEGAG